MWRVQQNNLLVELQGGASSFVTLYRLCSRKELWYSTFVSPFIDAPNHKPEINDTFLLTFHLDPSFLQYILFCFSHYTIKEGRESVVCITTRYGLDGPWIESRWRARFFTPAQTGPGAHPPTCKTDTVYLSRQ